MSNGFFSRALLAALLLGLAGTASAGVNFTSFPYTLNFDNGATSVNGLQYVSRGATLTHTTTNCWSGGCAKVVPSAQADSFAGLGDFTFPNSKRINVRYLMYFGADYVRNLNSRHKHILIHRGTADDDSDDRGMIYVWHYNQQDFTMGACDNTDCRYQFNTDRPNGQEAFYIGDYLQQWVSFEAEFDLNTHQIRLFVTTQDGRLNEHLLAQRTIHNMSDPSQEFWRRISMLGSYIDLGTTASPGMYWMFDEVQISNQRIGPPANFGAARPNPPTGVSVQ